MAKQLNFGNETKQYKTLRERIIDFNEVMTLTNSTLELPRYSDGSQWLIFGLII